MVLPLKIREETIAIITLSSDINALCQFFVILEKNGCFEFGQIV